MTLPLFGDDFRAGGRWLSGWLGMTLRLVGGAGSGAGPRYFSFVFSWPVGAPPFPDPFILLFASLLFCFFHPVTVLVSLCYFLFFPFLFTICGFALFVALLLLCFLRKKSKNNGEGTNPVRLLSIFALFFPLFPFFFSLFFLGKKRKQWRIHKSPAVALFSHYFPFIFPFFFRFFPRKKSENNGEYTNPL